MNAQTIFLTAALLALGCGDDAAKNSTLGTDAADMSVTADTSPADDGAPDLATQDVSKPDMAMPVDVGADIGPDAADVGIDMGPTLPPLEIDWPADPTEYAATANVTYIRSLVFPPVENNMATCCYDFGAQSKAPGFDNSFANLNQTLVGFGVSLNDVLVDTLTSGDLVALLDHRALDGPDDADGFVLAWLRAEFEGATDYASASAGTGTFLLDPDSLEPTGEAKLFFDPARMAGGHMDAGPAALSLLLPVLLSSLELRVEGARMSGDATIGADGVSYVNGTIAGYVAVQEVFDNLNAVIAAQCSCLGATGDFFTTAGNGMWSGQCVADPGALGCTEDLCVALGGNQLGDGGYCTVASNLLPQLADIDTNGDTAVYEAISLGLEWEGVTGAVVGIAP